MRLGLSWQVNIRDPTSASRRTSRSALGQISPLRYQSIHLTSRVFSYLVELLKKVSTSLGICVDQRLVVLGVSLAEMTSGKIPGKGFAKRQAI